MKNNRLLLAATLIVTALIIFMYSLLKKPTANTHTQSQTSLNSTPSSTVSPSASPTPSLTPSTPQQINIQINSVKSKEITNTANFIAGMNVNSNNSSISKFQKTNSWQNYQTTFNEGWSKLENQQLAKVRKWSQQELKQVNAVSGTVFYPFSGPDFLYAYSLFPTAKEYVLAGLEPVGNIPDFNHLSESQRELKLQEISGSLNALLKYSFFRTNDLRVDLDKQGVLPVLYIFLARTQNRILDVQYVSVGKNGKIEPQQKGKVSGVKITFVPKGESQARTLYYFSTDLSNPGLKKRPEFAKFVGQLNQRVTYLKAASYLMYNEDFSDIRKLILAKGSYLLQDDSGMPVKYFDRSQWNLKFYGTYNGPIDLFSGDYQADLREIYQNDKNIKPLNFGIGYKFGMNESNLMLAASKNNPANTP